MTRPLLNLALAFALFAAVQGPIGCTAKNVVRRVDGAFPTRDTGVLFTLPRTVVVVEIPIERVKHTDGTYCGSAQALGYPSGCTADGGTAVTLQGGKPTIKTRGEPDPQQTFLLDLDSRLFEDREITMKLAQSGILESGDAKSTNRGVDVAVKTVETLAKIAAAAAAAGSPGVPVSAAARQCDREIKALQARRDALFLSPRAPGQRADSLELAAKKLDEQIATKTGKCFTGTDKKEAFATVQVEFVPTADMVKSTEPIRLLAFVQKADGATPGICFPLPPNVRLSSVLEGEKRVTSCEVNSPAVFTVDAWVVPYGSNQALLGTDGDLSSFPSLAQKLRRSWADAKYPVGPGDELAPKSKELGFRFRVPNEVRIFITGRTGGQDRSVSAIADTQVAQLGPMVALPASTGSQSTQYVLTPYTETGGLKELKVVTTGFVKDGAVLESLATAAESAAKAKASTEGQSEFEKLEARRKKLDECKQLRTLQADLNIELTNCMD